MTGDISVTGILFLALVWSIPILIGYWVIRLAVRHGVADAVSRLDREGSAPGASNTRQVRTRPPGGLFPWKEHRP
ncbi:hypothetical protein [Intrasporangium mesophilum]